MSAVRRRAATLRGSRRAKPEGAKIIGPVDADEPLVVSIYLRNPAAEKHRPGSAADLAALSQPTTRRKLSRQRAVEFAPAVAAIRSFAKRNGLRVQRVQPGRRCVVLKGSTGRMAKAFGAELRIYDDGQRKFRARFGSLKMPPAVARWTRAVHGFDQRPLVMLRNAAGDAAGPGLWPSEIAALYGIPLDPPARQQCVGIIALGGGYKPEDIQQAAALSGRPLPTIVECPVDATNQYDGGTSADEEIALDMQVLSGIVAGVKICVYFAQNNTASLAMAIHQAVYDDVNRPTVLSICWGSAEKFWQPKQQQAADQSPLGTVQAALADCVGLKVSVVVASGDLLATGGVGGAAHVFFPSSSPYVLGCGGTQCTLQNNAISSEVVWKDNTIGTGGGISDVFSVPDYQTTIALPNSVTTGRPGRGVPDVAAAAGLSPGYAIILDANRIAKDGTSAATPLWAAMVALANARRTAAVGLVQPHLYTNPTLFRPIIAGDNRVGNIGYAAAPSLVWNACTGLGAPKGADIIAALAAA